MQTLSTQKISQKLQNFNYRGLPVHCSEHRPPHDDLASAGLGQAGLSSRTPPTFQDPLNPTPAELRRRAIYENYRALSDTSPGGGFGSVYGPEKPIPGTEVRGLVQDSTTVVVQIPDGFDPDNPKLLLVPASSSRGVYGGILLCEWGLQRGYTTVLCDKGCGTGFHNLSTNQTTTLDGVQAEADSTRPDLTFAAPDSARALEAFNARHPHRYATKHAHSGINVEARWGHYVLQSVEFAHSVLSALWPDLYRAEGCMVIATGLSNGGGASLRAAEQDEHALIHGLAVGEPNVCPIFHPGFKIRQGSQQPLAQHSKPLLEYAAIQNLFQPVASLQPELECAPFSQDASKHRLRGLQRLGLWPGLGAAEAALRANEELRRSGILAEQNYLAPGHGSFGVYEAMCVALANCLGRYLVTDHLFGYSYAAVDPQEKTPCPLDPQSVARLYALSNGLVPTGGLEVINDLSVGGPVQSIHSISAGTSIPDSNLDGALKLHAVATGKCPVNGELEESLLECRQRIMEGSSQTRATAKLGGRPALIVNGRCDSIIAPNHASRSYLGRNLLVEGEAGSLRYIEIEHAQHLDALNALPGFEERFVPILPYLLQALELVEKAVSKEGGLPPSQVVRSKPRKRLTDGVEALRDEHVPPIAMEVAESDSIRLAGEVLAIPE